MKSSGIYLYFDGKFEFYYFLKLIKLVIYPLKVMSLWILEFSVSGVMTLRYEIDQLMIADHEENIR